MRSGNILHSKRCHYNFNFYLHLYLNLNPLNEYALPIITLFDSEFLSLLTKVAQVRVVWSDFKWSSVFILGSFFHLTSKIVYGNCRAFCEMESEVAFIKIYLALEVT